MFFFFQFNSKIKLTEMKLRSNVLENCFHHLKKLILIDTKYSNQIHRTP